MLRAYISGRFNRIIYGLPDGYYSCSVDSTPEPASHAELQGLELREAEYEEVDCETLEVAREILTARKRSADCLFLFLSLLDAQVTLTSKVACAQVLEAELADPDVRTILRNRLLSRPLPESVRNIAHAALQHLSGFATIQALLGDVLGSQDVITTLYQTYEREASSLLSKQDVESLTADLDTFGFFPVVVTLVREADDDAIGVKILDSLLTLKARSYALAANKILNATRIAARKASLLKVSAKQKSLRFASKGDDSEKTGRRHSDRTVEALLASDVDNSFSRLSVYETKNAVDRQLEGIRKQIVQGRQDLVDKFLIELVEFQLTTGEREHLAKSLCLLSTAALAANQLAIAETISSYALQLQVDDHFVYTVRGEVLKYLGLFDAAISTYREARLRFPNDAYAWNGEPDVLKDAGRFDEALNAYKEVIARFPDDDVPCVGFVTTLRRKGSFAEAVTEGQRALRRFPESVPARFELGSSLLALGKITAAVKVFERAFKIDPRDARILKGFVHSLNVDGQSKRALELLRDQFKRAKSNPVIGNIYASQHRIVGNLSQAEEILNDLMKAFPGYAPARYTMASVLLSGKRLSEAKQLVPSSDLRSEEDWWGYRIYLLANVAEDPKEAVLLLKAAISSCPWPGIRSRLETIHSVALARTRDPKKALTTLQAGIEKLSYSHKQTRFALIGAVQFAAGRKDLAETVLNRILDTQERQLRSLRSAIMQGQIPTDVILPVLIAA